MTFSPEDFSKVDTDVFNGDWSGTETQKNYRFLNRKHTGFIVSEVQTPTPKDIASTHLCIEK